MVDKVYRFIYTTSFIVIGLGLITFLLGMFFLNNYRNNPSIEKIAGFLELVTPFAPIGTLFGTLKEWQTTRKKLTIILLTGLSVAFLLIFIWGSLFATAFD